MNQPGSSALTDNAFDVVHEVIEVDKCELSLEMGILAQMATCVTVLCAETLLNTEHISERRKTCLKVELRTLSEESWLPVIVELEESCATFDLGLHQARRRDFHDAVSCHGFTEGTHEIGSELENIRCDLSTEDKMAEIGLN